MAALVGVGGGLGIGASAAGWGLVTGSDTGTGTGTGFSGVDVWNQAISASTFKGLVIQSSADGAVTATITCAGLGTTITSLKINGEVAFVSATGLTVTGTDTLVLSATGTATVTVLYFG